MNLLLDAHTLIWAVDDPSKLGSRAHHALESSENSLLLSTGTIWEIAIKVGLKKLTLSQPFRQWMTQAIADLGLSVLPITVENAGTQIVLPNHHRDPFDRLLVAQVRTEGVVLISADTVFDLYGIHRLW